MLGILVSSDTMGTNNFISETIIKVNCVCVWWGGGARSGEGGGHD